MLYNVVFDCHGNTCYIIFIGAFFYMIYSTGQINVCTDFEINRFMGTTTLLIGILTRNILKPTRSLYDFRFKSYGSNSGFRVLVTLTFDLYFVTRIAHDVLEYPCKVS